MPISMVALQKKTVRVDLEYDGESFWVDYRPHAISEETLALEREWRSETGNAKLAEILSQLVVGWDILADANDKKPLEVRADVILETLPFNFLTFVYTALVRDAGERAKPKL